MTMQNKDSLLPSPEAGRDAVKTVLAMGGFLAAFGVASCCALPVALSLLGISAASLVGIGYLAAQYQQELFYAAAICLGASAFVMVRQRRTRSCAPGTACTSPMLDWSSKIALVLAVGLLVLTFWIEPPI
jgi:mercuric ion transport protein